MFDALGIIGSGMHVHKTWMDAISDNIANVNTVRPAGQQAFQARYVLAQSVSTGGAAVAGVALGNGEGRLVFDPTNPMADPKGYVRLPDIDLGEQMTAMIIAQRGYQANAANLDRVRASYQAALQMGRS